MKGLYTRDWKEPKRLSDADYIREIAKLSAGHYVRELDEHAKRLFSIADKLENKTLQGN